MEGPRREKLDWQELEEFLSASGGGTFYHTPTWLRPLEEVYGYAVDFLTLRRDGRLAGLLPFAERRRRGLLFRESGAFGSYGGPLLAPDAPSGAGGELVRVFLAGRRGRVARAMIFLPPDENADPAAPGQLPTHRADLSGGWEPLLAGSIRPAKRRQIRQAREAGVGVELRGGAEALDAYYDIYLESARRWKLRSPTPREHLAALVEDRERVRLWMARHEGRFIGGMLTFHHGDEVTYWHGANLREAGRLRPSALLYATVMETACREGARRFNMGASPDNPGLARFKEDFGGRATACPELRAAAPWLRLLQGLRRRP